MSSESWQAVADAADAAAVAIAGIPAGGEGYRGYTHTAKSDAELAEAARLIEKAAVILGRVQRRESRLFDASTMIAHA